ncbi:MAG: hypothetical protein H7840_06035 [Alphaproteobacteria bacterium]
MTPEEFEAELVRLGFRKTNITASLARRWEHVSGTNPFITEAVHIPLERLPAYLATIRRSLGLPPRPYMH